MAAVAFMHLSDPKTLRRKVRQYALTTHFLNELHDLLCSNEKYSEERKKLLSEYNAGQTALAAGIATSLSPYVGGGAQFIVAAAATSLTIIGQVGLKSWCGLQTERRQRDARMQEAARQRAEAMRQPRAAKPRAEIPDAAVGDQPD